MSFRTRSSLLVAGGLAVAVIAVVIGIISLGGDQEVVGEADRGGDSLAFDDGGTEAIALFRENCGQCHTLTVADTSADVGPDLDEARFGQQETLEAIEEGPGRMSAGILAGEEAEIVARLVGSDDPALGPAAGP